jgi:hypothetical protein
MTMPNFLIIGVMKAGTTSLHYYLKQHPQIYMSKYKEPKFFAYEGREVNPNVTDPLLRKQYRVTTLADYQALFADAKNEKAIGEASPIYLHSPEAPERIRHYIPEAHLFAILRHPVERAYSAYLHLQREGYKPNPNFAQELDAEESRDPENYAPMWFYKRLSLYYQPVKTYLDIFGPDRVHIYLYEDFQARPVQVFQDMCRILGVEATFVPDMSIRWNVTGVPKSRLLHKILTTSHPIRNAFIHHIPGALRWKNHLRDSNLYKPPMALEVRRRLINYFREDICKLQELIQRDLSAWLQ